MTETARTDTSRLDAFAYRHRVGEIMSAPLVYAEPATGVSAAAGILRDRSISSVVIGREGRVEGIFTERDLLRAIAAGGPDATARPVSDFMSSPVVTVRSDDLLHVAIGRMLRLGLRHLLVVDDRAQPVGMLTGRAVLKMRLDDSLEIGDETATAEDAASLDRVRRQLPGLVVQLIDEGLAPSDAARAITETYRQITRRAAEIAEAAVTAERGPAPCRWCLLILGSGGRGESLLAPDQDNAIVHDGGPEQDAWFLDIATRISDLLDAAGIPYCKGKVMATNPDWRRPLDGWREAVKGWVSARTPEALLMVDIFFDFMAVHGDGGLAAELRQDALAQAKGSLGFLRQLAGQIEQLSPPIGIFGGLRKGDDGRTDLKAGGILPIVAGARILALENGIAATGTHERLREAARLGKINQGDLPELIEAHEMIVGCILRQQLKDIDAGREPVNRIDPAGFTPRTIGLLKQALKRSEGLKLLVRDGLSH